jgi:hypothetical protein
VWDRKGVGGNRGVCIGCATSRKQIDIPRGLTVEARSKMLYGTPCFSRRAPSIRPPRPAPTIKTVGLSVAGSDIVA